VLFFFPLFLIVDASRLDFFRTTPSLSTNLAGFLFVHGDALAEKIPFLSRVCHLFFFFPIPRLSVKLKISTLFEIFPLQSPHDSRF